MTTKKEIVIVDDHPLVRTGFTELCASEPDLEVIGEASTASQGLQIIRELQPDLAIVDLALKSSSGLHLISQLNTWTNPPKVLILSMHDEVLYAERSMREGAWGYINKQESPDELLKAIRTILGNKIYLSKHMTQRVFERSFRKKNSWSTSLRESLSNRELQVFELIGFAHSTREIAESLNLSVKTVETYRENIKKKLGLRNSLEVIRRAVLWLTEETLSQAGNDSPPASKTN